MDKEGGSESKSSVHVEGGNAEDDASYNGTTKMNGKQLSGRTSIAETRVFAQNGDSIIHAKPKTMMRRKVLPGMINDLNPVRPDDPPEDNRRF